MCNKFHHLHVHSSYSFLDGYGLPNQYVDKLKNNGQKAMGLTDHGNTWGHIDFYYSLKKNNIKPVLGVEFYYAQDGINVKNQYYHITIFAKNNEGFINLNKLQTLANKEGFYIKPRIDFEMIKQHKEGLIILSGCMGSGFPIINIAHDEYLVEEWLLSFKDLMKDDFYVEITPMKFRNFEIKKIISLANKLKIKIAVTSDVHFPNKEDWYAEDVMLTIGMKRKYYDSDRMRLPQDLFLWDDNIAKERCKVYLDKNYEEYIKNTNEIIEKCNVEIHKCKRISFFKGDNGEKALKEFNKKIIEIKKRNSIFNKKEYSERIKYEQNIIVSKGFVDYFLIISDLIEKQKETMLVGPGRGSSAGSLIAYMFKITSVDPIKHGLFFERFIDITRNDLPDIDIDFPHTKRKEVIQYLINKYGSDRVALLGTLSYFKGKNSIWDVGRIFNLPMKNSKKIASLIIDREAWHPRKHNTVEDTYKEIEEAKILFEKDPQYKYAMKIEGQIRQKSIHAAGVALTNDSLFNYCSLDFVDEMPIACIDKKSSKKIDLLKIDVLSLKQLTILERIINLIGLDLDYLYNLNLEDFETYKFFKKGAFQGVFQFEGSSLKSIAKRVTPKNFSEFQILSALARPGSLTSGATEEYILRENGLKKIKYDHPILENITKESKGVIVYQEQIMKILVEMGGISKENSNKIRKLINDTAGKDDLNEYKESFYKGAKKKNIPLSVIEKIWNNIIIFGQYAFNKSHSVSYGYISYWSLFLKTHYLDEFFISNLIEETDDFKIKLFLKEWVYIFKRKFIPLHPDLSEERFSIKDGIIYGGFSNIKGLGDKVAKKIIEYRKCDNVEIFKKKIGKKTFEILSEFNCIPTFKNKQLGLFDEEYNEEEKNILIPYKYAPWANLTPIDRNKYSIYYDKYNFIEIKNIKQDEYNRILCIVVEIKENYKDSFVLIIEDNSGFYKCKIKKSLLKNIEETNILIVDGYCFNETIYPRKAKIID